MENHHLAQPPTTYDANTSGLMHESFCTAQHRAAVEQAHRNVRQLYADTIATIATTTDAPGEAEVRTLLASYEAAQARYFDAMSQARRALGEMRAASTKARDFSDAAWAIRKQRAAGARVGGRSL